MKKWSLFAVGAIGILVLGVAVFVFVRWDHSHQAPLPQITASTDSAVIARGRYLVYGPAHCVNCHIPMNAVLQGEQDGKPRLIGGWELELPLGVFRAPNITPDKETGIGHMSDAQLARALRYSVGHDGRFLMPFMPFQEMTDEDLTAVISFLRSQKPVRHQVPKSEYSVLGKLLLAFGVLVPRGPQSPPQPSVPRAATVAYGRYLAHSVADCYGCHTERDPKSGAFIGQPFAGGMRFGPDKASRGYVFVSPNITPDSATSILAHWDEQAFIQRFKAGRKHQYSPMPWGAFARMDTVDLQALYRYLRTVTPIRRAIPQIVYAPTETVPE